MGYQILGAVVIICWASFFSIAFFWTWNKMGWLRMKPTHEILGYDLVEMGGVDDEILNKLAVSNNREKIWRMSIDENFDGKIINP